MKNFTATDIDADERDVAAMNTGSKVTVLIAHDSPLLAAGLAAAFRTRGEFEVLADTAVPAELTADVIVADFDNGR